MAMTAAGAAADSDGMPQQMMPGLALFTTWWRARSTIFAAAEAAELLEEEWEAPPVQTQPKGKGKDKAWREEVWPPQRSAPYPDQQIVVASPAASHAFTDVIGRAVHAVAKAEAGARASSRMARQAFQAFEDEANALRDALDSLKNIR